MSDHRAPSARACAIAAAAAALTGCAAHVAVDAPPPPAEGCVVEGTPLERVDRIETVCIPSVVPAAYANALRLFQQERYAEAAERLEPYVSTEPASEELGWWQAARWWLAYTYAHLGRAIESDAIARDIVRDAHDPWRWTAAGQLCGDWRPRPHVRGCPPPRRRRPPDLGPPPEPIATSSSEPRTNPSRMELAAVLEWASLAVLECAEEREARFSFAMELVPDGSVGLVSILDGSFDDGAPVAGSESETCVARVLRRIRLAPFAGPSMTIQYRFAI